MSHRDPNGTVRGIIAPLLLAGAVSAWGITTPPPEEGKPQLGRMLDARVNLKDSFERATAARPVAASAGRALLAARVPAIANAIAARSAVQPGLEVRMSHLTGGPRSVHDKTGPLTLPAPGRSSESIVRGYLQQNGAMFGLSRADVDDLVVLGDSAGGTSGLRMLRIEQRIDGRPVFQSETRFLLDRDGRLHKAVGLMVPNARELAAGANAARFMAPQAAVASLLAAEGRPVDPAAFTVVSESGGRLELSGGDGYTAGPITARQVLFPLAPGVLVPAWSLVVFTTGAQDWYAIVDAETGDLLWRKGIRNYASAHDARFRVYVQADGTTPADSPAPQSPVIVAPGAGTQFPGIAPTIVSMHAAMLAADPTGTASPNGWIDDCPGGVCTAAQTQTLGNNVRVCLDRVVGVPNTFIDSNICDTGSAGVLDGNGRPTGNADAGGRNRDFLGTAPRDFETGFLPPPQASNPESGQTATGDGNNGTMPVDSFRRGVLTHLFYLTNWYHDKLYRLGFDEAAGNFQQTNFSGFGLGGDRVAADAQDGSGTNNANFSTPPDGSSGRMQMYVFPGSTVARDGSLDAEIVIHELTHGTSNRLVGNAAGLNWDPAVGLGEGWSDFYALSLLNNTNADDPNGRYASGAYATYKLLGYLDNYVYGIRRFPYSTDHAVNPMTWADVDDVTNSLTGGITPTPISFNSNGAMEVHNSGEIWALTLWGVRARVIADPAGANGNVPTGNHTMLQLVTDAIKMTPNDPSFTEARDAIVQADCATNACTNEGSIWGGFADRGLGYGAKMPYNVALGFPAATHMAVHESFSVPYLDVVNVATDVTINDAAPNNNNGAIDPGEAIRITVKLTNPWRAAGKAVTSAVATLTTSTPGIAIFDNTSSYGAIAPQGSATGDTFMFTVSPLLAAGAAIDFTLTTVSNLGTTATTFQLRVGVASGTDPVVTYTGNPNPDLAIPDNSPRGVVHQINVTDDRVIADLDFRIDSITHTWTGDVTAMLRSPGGIGVDLVGLIGALIDGGPGHNMVNMVIDDDLPATNANDMVQAPSSSAPFTRSWSPVFNSPWATLIGLAEDPVGNLSRYDGTSTKGTWSILVSDQAPPDTGTLNAWSILVTPVHFNIAPLAPSVVTTANKTVAGTFAAGQTVAYTVTLTNTGTANQADNPGHEFIDVLPSSLTLVNASATSGTAVATVGTNTVTWNGSLAPLGGSVAITITATIGGGTPGGTVVSNQGTMNYDADGNGSNESSRLTDDPAVGGASDPTVFTVIGTPAISLSTADLGFAPRVVGTASPFQGVTVTNTGTASLSLSAITVSGTNASDFTTGGTCTGVTVLVPAATCSIEVTFTPGGLGARSASLNVASNDPVNPVKGASLSGTGVAAATLFRSYVSPTGSDANPCTLPAPCRLLPAALAAVAPGGEIWILGSGNFNVGTVSIGKSVTILAVPGVLGSVVANNADAIEISGSAGIEVTLRNLVVLNLAGSGNIGIEFAQGSQLTVEGCEIYGMATGILAGAAGGLLAVKDTTLRDTTVAGVNLQGAVLASLDRVALLNNGSMGVHVPGGAQATISDSTISGSTLGASVTAASGTTARLALSATELWANGTAVAVSAMAGGDTAHVVLGDVTITHNGIGVALSGVGNTAVFSRLNNTLRFNTFDVTGGALTAHGAL